MSELKWNWVYFPYLDAPNEQEESALKAGYIKVVSKSEADKVIARQKYKRCLAMVKYCDMGLTYYNEKLDSFSCERADFFYRWYNRWWKLAEKFKEAK